MKKLLIAGTCIAALSISAFAQGTVNFANRVTGQLDAPIYDVDTTTKLAGTGYWAQLYSGGVAQGKPMNFRTGSGAGYFFSDAVTLNNVAAGGQANLQVKAWAGGAGSTYENSMPNGKSPEFTITTGGGGTPPGPAANLGPNGLVSFSLVPEPSVLALGAIGLAALLLRRRS